MKGFQARKGLMSLYKFDYQGTVQNGSGQMEILLPEAGSSAGDVYAAFVDGRLEASSPEDGVGTIYLKSQKRLDGDTGNIVAGRYHVDSTAKQEITVTRVFT